MFMGSFYPCRSQKRKMTDDLNAFFTSTRVKAERKMLVKLTQGLLVFLRLNLSWRIRSSFKNEGWTKAVCLVVEYGQVIIVLIILRWKNNVNVKIFGHFWVSVLYFDVYNSSSICFPAIKWKHLSAQIKLMLTRLEQEKKNVKMVSASIWIIWLKIFNSK